MEKLSLIEISSEDDLLIPSSLQELGIQTGGTREAEKMEKVRQNLEVLQLSDCPGQNQKVSDRYNLRKSLAWDSAFFTSEGILNAEELAIMNNTNSKAGITLPGIQELRISSESTSTIENDSWAWDQLEVNLLKNVQDSIQRSLGGPNNSTNMVNYDKINKQKKSDAPNPRTLKKIDGLPEIKLKPPTALRKQDVTRQRQEHTPKGGLVFMNRPLAGNAESKPLIRPPKVSSKSILPPASVPSKKASIETKERKGNTDKKQSLLAFNKANVVPGIVPRKTLLKKTSSGSQTGLVLTATLGSSSSSLTTSSSDSRSVSSLATVEKRSARIIKSHSSSRIGKNVLNSSINGSTVKNHLKNFAKSSLAVSKISPASSIASVVSESSSSTSTKFGNSLDCSDAGSSTSSVAFSYNLGFSQDSGSLSQSFVDDVTKSYINGDCYSRLARPSGLRMPMPTIGYFDKVKTVTRGSKRASKANLQNNLKNASVSRTGAASKVKPIDISTVRDSTLPSALSKQVSKSCDVNFIAKIENHQKTCPKISKISLETVKPSCKINFKNERVSTNEAENVHSGNQFMNGETNFLHPNVFAMENESEANGEPKNQSYRIHDQQKNMMRSLKAVDTETEKENIYHDLKAEDPSNLQKMEALIGGEDALSFTF